MARGLTERPAREGIAALARAAVRVLRGVGVRVVRVGARIAARIELGRPLTVEQHVTRFVDALRELFRLLALLRPKRELVRMVLDHQLAVGLLARIVGRAV